MAPVTLQVTLAPLDVRHARHILPHLLRVWGTQVSEVLLVVDGRESRWRAREEDGDARRAGDELDAVIAGLRHDGLRRVDVDRTPATRSRVAERFGARTLPDGDFRGRPYYTYLYGLAEARHDRVLHVDSDMLFGGGAPGWLDEADAWLARDETLVACSPLPGPPMADGQLRGQEGFPFTQAGPHAYRFANMSTRVFLADMPRWRTRLGSLGAARIGTVRSVLGSARRGQIDHMPLEERITAAMQRSGSGRLDFLGGAPGMWSLHPLTRTDAFHAALPALVAAIEAGEVTDAQRGHYDLDDSMIALAAARG